MGRLITIIICAMCVLPGCKTDRVIFNEEQEISSGTWSYGDQYMFAFTINDTTRTYRLELDITHSDDYQWENFYAQITTGYPADTSRMDVVSFELASRIGAWHGRCRRGACTVTIPLQSVVRFAAPGAHRISFEQYMRQEELRGINAIRLRLIQLQSED